MTVIDLPGAAHELLHQTICGSADSRERPPRRRPAEPAPFYGGQPSRDAHERLVEALCRTRQPAHTGLCRRAPTRSCTEPASASGEHLEGSWGCGTPKRSPHQFAIDLVKRASLGLKGSKCLKSPLGVFLHFRPHR